MGRQVVWGIFYDDISADAAIGAVRVKTDSLFQQLSAVFQPGDLVV